MHERPINSKCKKLDSDNVKTVQDASDSQGTNNLILEQLQRPNDHMTVMEEKVAKVPVSYPCPSHVTAQSASTDEENDNLILPSIASLKRSRKIQDQVDERIKQLQQLNKKARSNHRGVGLKMY